MVWNSGAQRRIKPREGVVVHAAGPARCGSASAMIWCLAWRGSNLIPRFLNTKGAPSLTNWRSSAKANSCAASSPSWCAAVRCTRFNSGLLDTLSSSRTRRRLQSSGNVCERDCGCLLRAPGASGSGTPPGGNARVCLSSVASRCKRARPPAGRRGAGLRVILACTLDSATSLRLSLIRFGLGLGCRRGRSAPGSPTLLLLL